jgi:pyruvate/2-oxoglutarate/acetoin dehydrogenase E1 component
MKTAFEKALENAMKLQNERDDKIELYGEPSAKENKVVGTTGGIIAWIKPTENSE